MVPAASSPTSGRVLPCGRKAPPASDGRLSEEKLLVWKAQLKGFLGRSGLRYTDQRWKIAELLLTAGGHLTAQELIDKVRQAHPDIGPATVYRNLKVLCDANILKESLTDSEGRIIYELYDEAHHDHIVCMDCGQIFEFHNDRIEEEQGKLARKLRFRQVRHRHVIYGRCEFLGSETAD